MATPRISVVVLTHQRANEIFATVARLRSCRATVLIVVDNASTGGTAPQITARFPSVRVAQAGAMAGACVFRPAVFRQVGGYEPRLFMGGEEELVAIDVLKASYRIVYSSASSSTRRALVTATSGAPCLHNAVCEAAALGVAASSPATFAALRLFAREGTLREPTAT